MFHAMVRRAVLVMSLVGCAAESKPPPNVEMVRMEPLPPAESSKPPPGAEDSGADPHRVDISVGAIATLPAKDVRSFSAANDNIDVRITPDGKTFVVAGKKKGRCDLLLVHKDGSQEIFTVEVYDR